MLGENPSEEKGRRHPVDNVSWHDVQDFIEQLHEKEVGEPYRLPTEAEWEYACRAGTTTPFSFGETITTDQVNYDGHYPYGGGPRGKRRTDAERVGYFPPNAWCLYEMHGNVRNWVADVYHEYYYKQSPVDDPDNMSGFTERCEIRYIQVVITGIIHGQDPGHRMAERHLCGRQRVVPEGHLVKPVNLAVVHRKRDSIQDQTLHIQPAVDRHDIVGAVNNRRDMSRCLHLPVYDDRRQEVYTVRRGVFETHIMEPRLARTRIIKKHSLGPAAVKDHPGAGRDEAARGGRAAAARLGKITAYTHDPIGILPALDALAC